MSRLHYVSSSICSIHMWVHYRPLTREKDHKMISWAVGGTWYAVLYNKFSIAGIVPASHSLTSRGKNAPRLYYNSDQTAPVFPNPSTPSLPIQGLFLLTVMGLITPLLCVAADSGCAVGKREKANADPGHLRWHAVSITTHTERMQLLTALREI